MTTLQELFARRSLLAEREEAEGKLLDALEAQRAEMGDESFWSEYRPIDARHDMLYDEIWSIDEAIATARIKFDRDLAIIASVAASRLRERDEFQNELGRRLLSRCEGGPILRSLLKADAAS